MAAKPKASASKPATFTRDSTITTLSIQGFMERSAGVGNVRYPNLAAVQPQAVAARKQPPPHPSRRPLKPCAITYHSEEPLRLAGGLACFTVAKFCLRMVSRA